VVDIQRVDDAATRVLVSTGNRFPAHEQVARWAAGDTEC
jgi:hypothetical protein